jgi:phosphate transport system permease protein
MTVLMVTGNAAVIPKGPAGFLQPVRTMTATIAAEMGETAYRTAHYHALFMVGFILFAITLAVNIIADMVIHRAGGMKT